MKVILGPVLEAINQLKVDGIPIKTATGQRILKACLLLAVFDLLAMACNTTQFNGNYGCLYCLDKRAPCLWHTCIPTK